MKNCSSSVMFSDSRPKYYYYDSLTASNNNNNLLWNFDSNCYGVLVYD